MVWPRTGVQAVLPRKADPAKSHTPRTRACPGRSIPVFLIKKQPDPVHLESSHRYHVVFGEGFQGKARPTDWSPDQPWPESQAKESWTSPQCLIRAVLGTQVLNNRKPPNAVPGGLLFIIDPWVSSNHTLSPFCSSAIAKVVAGLPPLCSSVV